MSTLMRIRNPRSIIAIILLLSTVARLSADFQLLENFRVEDQPLQNLENWTADSGFQLINQALALQGGNHEAYLPIPPINQGSTSTLFFRLYVKRAPTVDESIAFGLSRQVDPSVSESGGPRSPHFNVRVSITDPDSAASGTSLIAADDTVIALSRETEYNVWAVVDNDADTVDWYLSEGNDPASLPWAADVPFNAATTDSLKTLYFGGFSSNPDDSPLRLDDLYFDPTGENLTLPNSGAFASPFMPDMNFTSHLEKEGSQNQFVFEYTGIYSAGDPWLVPHISSDLEDWPPAGTFAPMTGFEIIKPELQEGMLRFTHKIGVPGEVGDRVFVRLQPSEVPRHQWHLTAIAENGVQESRRPHAVGLYAEEVNTTYLSWSGPGSQPCIMAYDHDTDTYSEMAWPAGIPGEPGFVDIWADKHNYPAIIRTDDGYLHVFTMRGGLKHFRSPAPDTIAGDWEVRNNTASAAGGSYQLPVVTSSGDVFVFFREGTSGVSYIHSTDHGLSWNRYNALTVEGDTENLNTIYPGGLTLVPGENGNPDRLLIAWTRSGKGPGYPDGYYDSFHKDAFVAWFDTGTRRFAGYDGQDLGDTVDIPEMIAHCRAMDTGDPLEGDPKAVGYFFVPAALDNGGIALAFEYWKDSGDGGLGGREDNGKMMVARWDGTEWRYQVHGNLVNPDLERDPDGTLRLYGHRFAAYDGGRGGFFYVMRSLDQGETWHLEKVLKDPERTMTRAYVIDNAHPHLKVLLNEWGNENDDNNVEGFYRIWTAGFTED